MTYAVAVDALHWAFKACVFLLAASIAYKMLIGTIPLSGLLSGRPGGEVEPERVQALLAAIAIPVVYLIDGIGTLKSTDAVRTLPDVQNWILAAGFGSQALYLAGKAFRTFVVARNAPRTSSGLPPEERHPS